MTINSLVSKITTFIDGFLLLLALVAIVSGIWLLFLGHWKLVLAGCFAAGFSNILLSIFFMPGIVFAVIAGWFAKKGFKFIAYPLVFIGGLLYQLVIVIWLGMVFSFSSLYALSGDHVLVLIFSYIIAAAPLAYFASKEKTREGYFALTMASLGYLYMLVKVLLIDDIAWGIKNIGQLEFSVLCFILLGQTILYFATKPKSTI